ncbi:ETEC_3214 domain-containing protein [Pseudomonas mohnii]
MTEGMKIARFAALSAILAALIGAIVTPLVTHYLEQSEKKTEALKAKNPAEPENKSVNASPPSEQKPILISAPTPTSMNEHPEGKLSSIFIGMSRPYVERLFGTPIVENLHDFNSSTEINYVFRKFYLQFIFSKSGSLQFYSLVSRSKDFKPCIPTIDKCLGNTFSDISKIQNTNASFEYNYVYSYLTSKHYGYGEFFYLGNAGNFQNYYLGFNSLGADYSNISPFVLDKNNKQEWDAFRSKHMPNAFGVGDIGAISDDNLYYEIGPEFYTFRHR